MSVQTKLQSAKRLASVIQKWPDDSHKVYTSFRNAQLKIYENNTPSELPAASTLDLRTEAATRILNNVHFNAFKPDPRIYVPDGNSHYYDLIKREANRERGKVGFITAVRHTLFGWWKK